jgi:hypothetical protein
MLARIMIMTCASIGLFADTNNWQNYQKEVLSVQATLPGWCVKEKATKMMDLIYEVKPEVCVEVGVFGGSSLFPTACALQYLGHGQVYAIDPWANLECLEGYSDQDPNYLWWNMINLEQIYQDFRTVLYRFRLDPYCVVMRTTGEKALESFADGSIDILHIDGNHTEEVALKDAQMYLPKMKAGGYIWFDDINWSSTKKAWEYLSLHCIKDEERSTDEYFLFKVKG